MCHSASRIPLSSSYKRWRENQTYNIFCQLYSTAFWPFARPNFRLNSPLSPQFASNKRPIFDPFLACSHRGVHHPLGVGTCACSPLPPWCACARPRIANRAQLTQWLLSKSPCPVLLLVPTSTLHAVSGACLRFLDCRALVKRIRCACATCR